MDALDGVQAKLDRASEHAHSLREEIRSLNRDEFYTTIQKQRPKPDKRGGIWYDGYLKVLKDPPIKLGILAGDVAHNLRACLDHLVYQLAILDNPRGRTSEGTFFPIAKSNTEYTALGPCNMPSLRDRALVGISEPHRALIDAEQPYVGRNRQEAEDTFLSVLNAFSNTDKHRIIQVAVMRPVRVDVETLAGDGDVTIDLPRNPPPVITDGAHIYSLRVRPTGPPGVRVETRLTYAIGFGNRGLTDADFLNMCVWGKELVNRFRPLWT